MQFFLKIFLSLILALAPLTVSAEDPALNTKQQPNVDFRATIGNDTYALGSSVNLTEDGPDDTFALGQIVNLTGKVAGDLSVAGENLSLLGAVGDDLRAAGKNVLIGNQVGGSALVAGSNVSISDKALFGAESRIFGASVDFAGKTKGNLTLSGETVRYSGTTDGDLRIDAGRTLVISPDAKVSGKLTYSAKQKIEIPAGVAQEVIYLPDTDQTASSGEHDQGLLGDFDLMSKLLSLVIFFLAGMVALALLGKSTLTLVHIARQQVWQSILTGIVLFFLPVFLGFILLITIFGSLVGAGVLIAWLALLALAGALSGYIIGSLLWRQTPALSYGQKLLTLSLGLAVIALLELIPRVGDLLGFLIFIYSLGAVARTKITLYKAAKKAKLL